MTLLRVDSWSYSRYQAWADCPKAFYAKNISKTVKFVQTPAMARGDKIHRGIEAYLRGEADVLPEAKRMDKFKEQMRQLREMPDKVVEMKWAFNSQWKAASYFGRGSNVPWLRVILDVGLTYPDNTGEVIDHKTGQIYGSNDDQVELFAVATMSFWPWLEHVTTRLWYLDDGSEAIAEFPRSDYEKLRAKWEAKVAPMMADTEFVARPNQWCHRCPLAKSNGGDCRFG